MKPQLKWKTNEFGEFLLKATITTGQGDGTYEIHIAKRPYYCDRGDWMIYVFGVNNDLDYADGFPRYFFGTDDEVKLQMETWLNRRKAYRDAHHEEEKKKKEHPQ